MRANRYRGLAPFAWLPACAGMTAVLQPQCVGLILTRYERSIVCGRVGAEICKIFRPAVISTDIASSGQPRILRGSERRFLEQRLRELSD